MTAPCTKTTLTTIYSRYALKDIFDADEFGLFYQCLPSKTMHFKDQTCSGGKHSKVRLTGLAAGKKLVRRLISSFEKKASMPAISILSDMMWLSKAWNTLPDKTFTNCFRKCGISKEAAASAIADEGNPFAGLGEDDEDTIINFTI